MKWPTNYGKGWTLSSAAERKGIGLHGGQVARVRLQGSSRPGYWLGWLDQPEIPLQRLNPTLVSDTTLCTALRLENRRLATVEHLLAALAGTGVSQAEILVEGEEIPLLDGSSLPWVEAIAEAGLVCLGDRRLVTIPADPPFMVRRDESFALAVPFPGLRVTAAVEYPQPAIGRQIYSLDLTPVRFVQELAPARTFGFCEQLEELQNLGLIRGGALNNALVCDGEGWLNPPLRFPDEPVRHKLTDLLGDLALVGFPQAQVFVYRGSHRLHTELAKAIFLASASSSPIPASTSLSD